jgi:hypothetical protein
MKERCTKMIYTRTIITKIPDYNYFKEALFWDIDSIEELTEILSDMTEEELQETFNNDGFGNNIKYYNKIEMKER